MITVGEKITPLTHTRGDRLVHPIFLNASFSSGYSAQLSTAMTVLLASAFGLPISTTHTLVGSVTGIGLVPGTKTLIYCADSLFTGSQTPKPLNKEILVRILIGWAVTLLVGGIVTIGLFLLLRLFL